MCAFIVDQFIISFYRLRTTRSLGLMIISQTILQKKIKEEKITETNMQNPCKILSRKQ